jgi:hypothetical protein
LIIRESVAEAQGMSVSFEELVKLQLFERCASGAAFEYLIKHVGESEDGKPKFLQEMEEKVAKAEEWKSPDESWDNQFIKDWIKLNPRLSNIDLRPLLYLSRDKALSLANFDELSPDGRELLSGLCDAKSFYQPLIEKIRQLGEFEAEKILTRMIRRIRKGQWEYTEIMQALHIPKSFPQLAKSYLAMLDEIPANKRPSPLIPQLRGEIWAQELLSRWKEDEKSPSNVIKAIKVTGSKK